MLNLFGLRVPKFGLFAPKRARVFLTISGDTTDYDVGTQALLDPDYDAGNTDIELTIDAGIYVGESAVQNGALTVDTNLTAGDRVTIINNGFIIGKGGARSSGVGGDALIVNYTGKVQVDNQGSIYGGGGGGGKGANAVGEWCAACGKSQCCSTQTCTGGAGGAGAGYTVTSGASKTSGEGGLSGETKTYCNAGEGAAGGSPGANGGTGEGCDSAANATCTGKQVCTGRSCPSSGSGGGSRGYYVKGDSNITWQNTGTRSGLSS